MSDIVSTIFQKGVLFDITIGKWGAIHLLQPEDLLMERVNKKAMHLGHVYLIARDDMRDVERLDAKIRSFVASMSMSFPIAGAVFVNFRALKKMLAGLKKLEAKFKMEADYIIDHYDELKEKQLLVLDEEVSRIASKALAGYIQGLDAWTKKRAELDIWEKSQRARYREMYPPKEKLPAKFHVSWRMFKIDPMGSGEIDGLDAEMIQEKQDELRKDLENWVKDASAKIHQVLGKQALETKELLAKQGKLNAKNMKPLFEAFQKFAAVDFAGSDWQASIDNITKQYLVTDQDGEINYSAVAMKVNEGGQDAFAQLLDQVAVLAQDEVAKNTALYSLGNSDFKRVIEL